MSPRDTVPSILTTRRACLSLALTAGLSTWEEQILAAEPSSVTWSRDRKDPRWVQGQALVSTPAAEVWTRLQRVDEWPRMFSDIKWLRVVERSTDHWRVRLESKTMTCGAHDYHIQFQRSRSGKVVIDAPGTTSSAYFRVFDGKRPADARVVYSLFIEIRGIVSWFVSERTLREKQEQMVERYLRDIDGLFNVSK